LGKENSPQMGRHQSSPALVTVTLGCWTPSWIYPKRHRSGTSGTYFSPQMGKEADPRLGCHPSRQHWSRRRLGPPRRRRMGANGCELNRAGGSENIPSLTPRDPAGASRCRAHKSGPRHVRVLPRSISCRRTGEGPVMERRPSTAEPEFEDRPSVVAKSRKLAAPGASFQPDCHQCPSDKENSE